VVHSLYEKVVAGYPRIPDTQEQAVDGELQAVALLPTPEADGGVPSAHRVR